MQLKKDNQKICTKKEKKSNWGIIKFIKVYLNFVMLRFLYLQYLVRVFYTKQMYLL